MRQRNWLELSRKLVDRYDMDFEVSQLQFALGEYSLSYYGMGVLATTQYPNPFLLTMSGVTLGGTVGNGIAYDPNGQLVRIDTSSPSTKTFVCAASHPSLARWDLLVIRYKKTGNTPIPKPSDPISTVNLNLSDDFELAVLTGTPSGSPAYPVKGTGDIILAGLRVPAGATLGTQIILDLSVRDIARAGIAQLPVFEQEVPAGTVDGSNKVFTLSKMPTDPKSVIVILDSLALPLTDYTLINQTITFVTAPAVGQQPYAYYTVESPTSQNPLEGTQEIPSGIVDGVNDTFNLLGKPMNNKSTMVFVDGTIVPGDQWALEQSLFQASIKFLPGFIPVTGQAISVYYFVNAASSGSGPVINTSGGYTVLGKPIAMQINPTIGLIVTPDQRQLKYVRSVSGYQVVTANPQIAAGNVIGQELLMFGTSDTDYPEFNHGNGLSLNGAAKIKNGSSLSLVWDGSIWIEVCRSL